MVLNEGVGVAPPPMMFVKCRMDIMDGIGYKIWANQGEGPGGAPIGTTF